jgi:hypothetical protein
MLSPHSITTGARLLLAASGVALTFATLACPALSLELEAVAALIASHCAMTLTFAAFPWHRRWDLLRAVAVVTCAMALGRMTVVTEVFPATLLACLLGTGTASFPLVVEKMRGLTRRYGTESFATIRIEEQRRERRGAAARQVRI